jgi:aryl-alcohol dehydrogenase-like predicted oxidoreductase
LAALARPAYITAGRSRDLGGDRAVEALRSRTSELLDVAYRHDVRYLDVARSYGRAEEFLAGWLAGHPGADDVLIGSKWGYRYVGGWRTDAEVHEVHEVKDHSPEAFVDQYGQTRALLGGRLAVYQVHSATPDTGVLDDTELHRVLAGLRADGVALGISTSGPAQADAVRRALEVRVDGEPLFTSIQSTWNVLEPSVGDALAEAADDGAYVIVKEAVANGRLTDHGVDGPAAARVAALAERLELRTDQLALAAVLAQPWAWQVLSGAVTPAQLESNLAAEDIRLPPDVLAELADLAEPAGEYWAARSRRPWN